MTNIQLWAIASPIIVVLIGLLVVWATREQPQRRSSQIEHKV